MTTSRPQSPYAPFLPASDTHTGSALESPDHTDNNASSPATSPYNSSPPPSAASNYFLHEDDTLSTHADGDDGLAALDPSSYGVFEQDFLEFLNPDNVGHGATEGTLHNADGDTDLDELGLNMSDFSPALRPIIDNKVQTRTAPAFHSLIVDPDVRLVSSDMDAHQFDIGEGYLYDARRESSAESDEDVAADDSTHAPRKRRRLSITSHGLDAGVFDGVPDIFGSLGSAPQDAEEDLGGGLDPVSRAEDDPVIASADSESTTPPVPAASSSTTPPLPTGPAKSEEADVSATKKRERSNPTCETCGKKFTRKSDLERHERIHTGNRPFPCPHDDCGKSFIQRSALHVHLRTHTGEKPHQCEYPGCDKTFSDSSALARHRRTHTGKRPYKCEDPLCDKTFTRRTTLVSHMRTHDPNWEPDPNIKYNFGAKKRKHGEGEASSSDDHEPDFEESVRTISALLHQSDPQQSAMLEPNQPLETRVATISAQIARAIADAEAEGDWGDEEVDELDDDDDGGASSAAVAPQSREPYTFRATTVYPGPPPGPDSAELGDPSDDENPAEDDLGLDFGVLLRARKKTGPTSRSPPAPAPESSRGHVRASHPLRDSQDGRPSCGGRLLHAPCSCSYLMSRMADERRIVYQL
ncbi:unnamed protein product [Peniophora sp. CBMAI 1063]|nr:unnamed protein product [Peniophora sp. CBMAI 1063]